VIVDTSALVAILRREPEEDSFLDVLLGADRVRIAAPTLLEIQLVASGYRLSTELDELLDLVGAQVIPFDEGQARLAFEGFEKFGKGRHAAHLNFGDCFSYAASKELNEPLLFKGGDFAKTDVIPAQTSA
jgi:ribonuclease VapC